MRRLGILPLAVAAAFAVAGRADDAKPKAASADDVAAVLKAIKNTDKNARGDFYKAVQPLEQQLNSKDTAEAAAKLLLDRKADFDLGAAVGERLDGLVAQKKAPAAAELLLQVVKAKMTVAQFGKGGVVVGKVSLADGKLEPDLVMAQMPILPDGTFAGEVGDMTKPIGFRAAGYEAVDVPLKGKAGEVLDVGTVVMKPLPAEKAATLKGKLALDAAPDGGEATVRLSLGVPPSNTPHGGYSPRRRWPQGETVKVGKDGTFLAANLTPGSYYVSIEAKGHTPVNKSITVEAGKENDQGTLRLRSTDLGFYIGKTAPKTEELKWEKDYAAAMKKAAEEKKPVLVMMTATWCGPCKMLEKQTLNDPWVRHFLTSNFVMVQAYEDKEVEKKYGLNGYPTLVFADSTGKEAHRAVGFQPTVTFLGQVVKGFDKLTVKLPAELQELVNKKVLGGE